VRRLIQVFALMLAILSGSLPGAYLLGPAPSASCCGSMPTPECPCRPARSPGPTAPCGLATTSPAAILAAPCRLAQTRPARPEPSPFPPVCPERTAARLPLDDPSLLARPGPAPGPGPDRHALLSVFRI